MRCYIIQCKTHCCITQCKVRCYITQCKVRCYITQCKVHCYITQCKVHCYTIQYKVHCYIKQGKVHCYITQCKVRCYITQCKVRCYITQCKVRCYTTQCKVHCYITQCKVRCYITQCKTQPGSGYVSPVTRCCLSTPSHLHPPPHSPTPTPTATRLSVHSLRVHWVQIDGRCTASSGCGNRVQQRRLLTVRVFRESHTPVIAVNDSRQTWGSSKPAFGRELFKPSPGTRTGFCLLFGFLSLCGQCVWRAQNVRRDGSSFTWHQTCNNQTQLR